MAGATHPFFGNQYTNGGYKIGSFKFPEGLTREVGERIAKVIVTDTVSTSSSIPAIGTVAPLNAVVKTGAKNKWVIPAIFVSTVTATGGYLFYRYFKKKESVKIPNVGVCEYCGEPLTGAEFVSNNNTSYIICKKCYKKNHARYFNNETNNNEYEKETKAKGE